MSLAGFNGWATVGGRNVLTSGLASSTLVQDSHPFAVIAVYISGTTTLATIYSDDTGTPLSNPFTADADGYWIFWAAAGVLLDVEMSGGIPPFSAAFTLVALPGNNFGSGRVPGGGPTGLISINGDTTPAQVIVGSGTVVVSPTVGGITTITGTGGGGGGLTTIAIPVSFPGAGNQVVIHNLNTTNPLYSVLSFGGATAATVTPVDANSVRVAVTAAASLVVSFAFVAPVAAPAPVLASLTLAPASVVGGVANSTGTVTITGAAPAGGAIVTLTSSNPAAATVPASVTIAVGASTATFTVTSLAVSANTTVTVTGNYGATQSANLTVTPVVVAAPIYGGVGAPGATASPILLSGTNVLLDTGDFIPQIKASPEVVGDQWTFSPAGAAGQAIYLLLVGGTHTFTDVSSGLAFAFNPAIQVSLSGRTMFLYQTQFALIGTYTVRVSG